MPADMLGSFRLGRKVASDGMGAVHEGLDAQGQPVCIRLLPADALHASGEQRDRVRALALTAAGLQHPGIVELLDFGWEDDTAFVVTALVEGETLAQYLARVGRLPALQGLALALQLLSALTFAHQRGLVHSALHPQHVLMGRNGQLKIAGFGWVAAAASAARRPGVFDAPAYMAPEQILGRPADLRSDLYSAAVVAYELLAGSWPYQAHAAPQPPRALRRELPVALDAVFERAQAQSPQARYPNAGELAAALQAAFGTPVWERALVPARPSRAAEKPAPVEAAREVGPAAVVAPRGAPARASASVPASTPPTAPAPALGPARRRLVGATVAAVAAAAVLGAAFVGMERLRAPGETPERSATAEPVPGPVAVAPVPPPPPALPSVQAVSAAASLEPPSAPEKRAEREPPPLRAKTRVADARPREAVEPRPPKAVERPVAPSPPKAVERPVEPSPPKIVERPAEPALRETVEPAPEPRPRETVERPAPQRSAAAERPSRTTTAMAAPPAPSPQGECRQEFSMARELCLAYECASARYRHHPVCVRMHADAVVRHKLKELRNGP